MSTRIILRVRFPDADNDVVLRSAVYLPVAVWLILVMTNGPIITLMHHSKFKAFQEYLLKFKDFKALDYVQ